jgi:hypothetical protein
MRSTTRIKLAPTMPKDEVHGNPSKRWDGHLLLCTMSNSCTNCSTKGMFRNFVGGVGIEKPSPKTSLEEQALKEKKIPKLKFGRGFSGNIVTNQN